MKRAYKVIGFIVAAGLLCCLGRSFYFHLHPIAEFETWTGRALPAGFQIARSSTAVTDPILRSSYYCMLRVPAGAFNRLLDGTGFAPSTEAKDGHWEEVRIELVPNLRAEDILEAYGWYRAGQPTQFILRDRTGNFAYYVVSTL